MLEQFRLILKALPWTGPAIVVGAFLALVSFFLFARRRSHADRVGFALVVWCLVVAAVVTLSPVKNDYFGIPAAGCDWSIWRPLARDYWFSSGSRPPNVWLFFPAGVGVMLLDGFWRKFPGIAFLLALPPGIETIQDLYPELKRSCSSQDVVDNWTGLAIGLLIGAALALLVGIYRFFRGKARARRERKDAALYGEPAAATPAAQADLPLGGGEPDAVRYDEFSDFDDRPNSTRWYEDYGYTVTQPQPSRGGLRGDDGRTRAMPTGRHLDPESPYSPESSDPDDPDATQIIRRR